MAAFLLWSMPGWCSRHSTGENADQSRDGGAKGMTFGSASLTELLRRGNLAGHAVRSRMHTLPCVANKKEVRENDKGNQRKTGP